jgi:hypothetical protein
MSYWDLIKFHYLADTTQRGDRGVKAERIGREREGDFTDNFIILDVVNIGRGSHTMPGWVYLFIEQVNQQQWNNLYNNAVDEGKGSQMWTWVRVCIFASDTVSSTMSVYKKNYFWFASHNDWSRW